ncbi:MAG TPA: DUF2946 family protein [Rubrivivax sp.]|nr:DUF2946 family protein [Rubrivivax sp.]
MDEIVEAALRKWPNVPHCYGWLALDARGDWYLRDAQAQAAGPFARIKGSRIEHRALREFIERNYEADARGCWYFQNGPQRVYVELQAAPWVWRLSPGAAAGRCGIATHTGLAAQYQAAWTDADGRLYLQCDRGFGLVHSLDVELAAQQIEAAAWQPQAMDFASMPACFGYVLQPRP